VPAPTGQPALPRPDIRAAGRTGHPDPVAVQRVRRRRHHQQLGGLTVRLRRQELTVAGVVTEIILSEKVAAALRELTLLDTDCERLVFRLRAHPDGAILAASDDDLDELIGFVAAEANHELKRRRQRRLDTAFGALSTATQTSPGW
jgi:hypothetical protein